jgi:hypothetical protein
MAESRRTEGEQLFEQYLGSIGLPFEYEQDHAGKSKVIDYRIEWKGKPHFLEVKDFESPPLPTHGSRAVQPYDPIRERILRCRKKFKEYKDYCCAAVFFNTGALAMLEHSHVMLGSMYGDSGFRFPFNTGTGTFDASKMEHAFLGGGMMIGPHGERRNTTISALITLTKIKPDYQKLVGLVRSKKMSVSECIDEAESNPSLNTDLTVPRVIVWHNAMARMPFPDDLFCGPYDTHFGVVTEEGGAVDQTITFRGGLLPSHIDY